MNISRRDRDNLGVLPLRMDGTELEEVESMKLLGVKIDSVGSAKWHVREKAAIAAKLVGMLRRQSNFLSESARFHVYVACIRPIFEYCSPITEIIHHLLRYS